MSEAFTDYSPYRALRARRAVRNDKEGTAFVIEIERVPAGIIVRQQNGFRFFASSDDFAQLEGSLFKTPQSAQKAADLIYRNDLGRNVHRFPSRSRNPR